MLQQEGLLLFRRELDHAVQMIVMKGREDPAVDAKIRMSHVGALAGVLEAEGDTPKIVGGDRANAATLRHLFR